VKRDARLMDALGLAHDAPDWLVRLKVQAIDDWSLQMHVALRLYGEDGLRQFQ
jgi:hypothetical protein